MSVGGKPVQADAEDFLNGTGAYAGDLGGLNGVDLWIGGLAEKILPFGGMLGSTFNFVFENQMESLQNGDRFYYLQRLDGQHLFGEMENNSFSELIMANTDATAPALRRVLHARADPRGRPRAGSSMTSTATATWRAPTRPAAASSRRSCRATIPSTAGPDTQLPEIHGRRARRAGRDRG